MSQEIVVGTRQSMLALWQARWVVERLGSLYPGVRFPIKTIRTQGDKILDVALAKIGDKGLFTKELEYAILQGEVRMAVHSMKDLPTAIPSELTLAAVCEREYPGDVLVCPSGLTLDKLPPGARVGTSSLRRAAQLLHYRPDLQIVSIRGNVNTRLSKIEEQRLDAVVLAYAGMARLGLADRITERIPFEICLPAVGQGSIGVEAKKSDEALLSMLQAIDHEPTRAAITAERAFLRRLEGGCQVPIAAYAACEDGRVRLSGLVASLDGREVIRHSAEGLAADAQRIGIALAESMLEMGAGRLLRAASREAFK